MQKDFLTITPDSGGGNGSLNVVAAANTGAARTSSITVAGSGVSKNVAVSQPAGINEIMMFTAGFYAKNGTSYTPITQLFTGTVTFVVEMSTQVSDFPLSNTAELNGNLPEAIRDPAEVEFYYETYKSAIGSPYFETNAMININDFFLDQLRMNGVINQRVVFHVDIGIRSANGNIPQTIIEWNESLNGQELVYECINGSCPSTGDRKRSGPFDITKLPDYAADGGIVVGLLIYPYGS